MLLFRFQLHRFGLLFYLLIYERSTSQMSRIRKCLRLMDWRCLTENDKYEHILSLILNLMIKFTAYRESCNFSLQQPFVEQHCDLLDGYLKRDGNYAGECISVETVICEKK